MKHAFLSPVAALLALCAAWPAAAEFPKNIARDVIIENRCEDSWRFVFVHSPRPGEWLKSGFYLLDPGERIKPTRDGGAVQHRDNASLYYYGERADGQMRTTGDHGINFADAFYNGREAIRIMRGKSLEVWHDC